MILAFKVANYLSFDDIQTVSFFSGDYQNHEEHIETRGPFGILDISYVFGPNSAGKSNLVRAISYSADMIVNSSYRIPINASPYRNNKGKSAEKLSYFEYVFVIDEDKYYYGLEIDTSNNSIVNEWLLRSTDEQEEYLFEIENHEIKTTFDSDIRLYPYNSYLETMHSSGPHNSHSRSNNNQIGKPDPRYDIINTIAKWFRTGLLIYTSRTTDFCIKVPNSFKKTFSTIISSIDAGINSIDYASFDNPEIPINLLKHKNLADGNYISFIEKKRMWLIYTTIRNGKAKHYEVKMKHGRYKARIDEESLGTRRVIHITSLILSLTDQKSDDNSPQTVVIDEFECSIHCLVTRKLVQLFHELRTPGSQMLLTTHESRLLDDSIVRPDEVWFINRKNELRECGSEIYSLKSFDGINDYNAMYLDGRLEGVPKFKELELE